VAAVWLDIFNNLEECAMDTFRQYDDCTLQISRDGGSSWTTIFDAQACVAAGILDKLDDGTLAPGGQQPPGGEGEPTICYPYKVKLNGNSRWLCPLSLQAGDSVQVSNARGGWYNGAAYPVGPWNCPDGLIYALGGCGGTPTIIGTNPVPDLGSMRLIGNCAAETTPYFDMYNTTYVLSGSSTPSDFYLLPNDDVLSDNQGDITFDVLVCKGGWIHTFDFTLASHDDLFIPHESRAIWESGVGWKPNPAASSDDRLSLIQFDSATFASTTFKSVFWSLGDELLTGRSLWQWFPNGSVDRTESEVSSHHTTTSTDTMTHFFLGLDSVADPCPPLRFVTFTGIGTDPF